MKQRCNDPNKEDYPDYGGRGITNFWDRFEDFLAYALNTIGLPPSGKSIDRIDNDGNYEPGNVRWSTPREQNDNKRPRKDGILSAEQARAIREDPPQPRRLIAADYGISVQTICDIKKGRLWRDA